MIETLLGIGVILLLAVFVLFLYCARVINEYENINVKELQRNLKIKDNYLHTIYSIGYDFDDYNNIKLLKETLKEMVELSDKAINCDDNYVIGKDKKTGKEYNILMEEVKRE